MLLASHPVGGDEQDEDDPSYASHFDCYNERAVSVVLTTLKWESFMPSAGIELGEAIRSSKMEAKISGGTFECPNNSTSFLHTQGS